MHDPVVGARLLAALPGFLRHPLTPAEARAVLHRRWARREDDFLALVQRAAYARPASPWARLLAHAGCEAGDLAQLVARDGIEGALRALLRAGVYLTADEVTGCQPVRRGSLRLTLGPGALRNPLAPVHLPIHSGGSRTAGTPVGWSLAFVRERSATLCLAYGARGGTRWRYANWSVPGSGALVHALDTAGFGAPPARWFSQVDPAAPGLHRRYRWSGRLARWGGRLAGRVLPRPEHVPPGDPMPIVRWLRHVLDAGETPHLLSYTTSVVRLAEAAQAAGVDLAGAELTFGGEPVTEPRLLVIRRSGARAVPRYAMVEAGLLAEGCLCPGAPDQMHVLHDLVTLLHPEPGLTPLADDALLVSSLRPTAPLVWLNVATGDRGRLGGPPCGCPLEALGWTGRLEAVRSDAKLTAGGMTVPDAEVADVLERVLPARFGGSPAGYQLVEEAAGVGARLCLLIHPDVGPVDARSVQVAFLEAIAAASPAARVMALAWSDAGVLRVERRPPLPTASGKILHLHRERRPGPEGRDTRAP